MANVYWPTTGFATKWPPIGATTKWPSSSSGRTWPSGAVATPVPPGTPFAWYDAQDITAGSGQPVDGANVTTWKNKGSLGAAADLTLQAGNCNFRAIAVAGKISNMSSVQGDGTGWMRSPNFTARSTPNIVAMVFRMQDFAGSYGIHDGRTGGRCGAYAASGTGLVHITGTGDQSTGKTLAITTFHTMTWKYNGATSYGRLDGSQGGNVNPVPAAVNGITLWGLDTGIFLSKMHVVEYLAYDDGTVETDIESYYSAKYGVTPQ